ncbi:MAG: uroporphyrinogen-III C-methyltransferase [Alphaproteobacteria bacterium GM7ARS4]|nr:uroporphyrinogen-III C-methyltransferase [Alphaproteobacteria bacterium GM7ARS4]
MSSTSITDALNALPVPFVPFHKGDVWIAGAGPGAPHLLTLETLYAIQHADVMFHDALITNDILALVPQKTRVILTGKRYRCKDSCDQVDIHQQMIEAAQKNKRVLRLKGGDPLLFARGGEEAIALARAKIRIRILPGISAAFAACANAAIPLTHRDHHSAITFATATLQQDKTAPMSHILEKTPLILYMVMHQLRAIAQQLIDMGYSPQDHVAIIENASRANEKITETRLQQCLTIDPSLYDTPALVIIGSIIRLRSIIKDYMKRESTHR